MNEELNGKKVSPKAVQHGLERKNTGKPQTLWVEEPGICDFKCRYCYACGSQVIDYTKVMTFDDWVKIIDEAKRFGVDSIGIPGAGEPFYVDHKMIAKLEEAKANGKSLDKFPGHEHPYYYNNSALTMDILRKCKEEGIYVTLFTTGEFMTPELAQELLDLPVEIMLKGNTLDPEMQDKFVSNPEIKDGIIEEYGHKRNRAIQTLMDAGFNDYDKSMESYGRESRMALVTSIMTDEDSEISNYDDILAVQELCRLFNIIFDVDSVLKRGRGANCELCTSDELVKQKLLELQRIDREKYGISYELSQSYIGTICDRYMHHMYIDQRGKIRPCIGSTEVDLGNFRDGDTLESAWNSPEQQIIRNREYHGKCGNECANFAEGKCNSCLGRRTEDLNNQSLIENGYVKTIGCWNFRAKDEAVIADEIKPEQDVHDDSMEDHESSSERFPTTR